ncbi:MAG: hypothetical protein Ct9H300mP1_08790 [Planctomycetaceae bacterium]|nr:MAG: hypothetical protein Ct9H300mP1_08790 [Planctomycetaceae bacterium]
MRGFDFAYSGNHDALVAEALGTMNALEGLMEMSGSEVLNYEPAITLSLDETCRRPARLMIETRTNAYQVPGKGDFPEELISVYFTVRQYGSLEADASFEDTLVALRTQCEELLDAFVTEQILRPWRRRLRRSDPAGWSPGTSGSIGGRRRRGRCSQSVCPNPVR